MNIRGRGAVRAAGLILGAFAMLLPAWGARVSKSVLANIATLPYSHTALASSSAEPRITTIFNPLTVAGLISDINTANTNGTDDVIDLGGNTFILTARNNTEFGYNGLPSILSDSAHTLTIQNGTIERDPTMGTPSFRLLHISSGANLTLLNITLTNGLAKGGDGASGGGGGAGLGGALFNQGSLSIVNSTINANKAQGGNGGGPSNVGGGAGGLGGNGGDGNGNSNGAGGGGGGFGGNGGAGNSGADTAGGGGGTTGDGGTPTAGVLNGGTGGTGNGTSGTAATGAGGGGGAGVGNDNGNGGNGGNGGIGGGGGGAGGGGGTAGSGGNGGAGGFGGGGGAAGGGSGSGTRGTGGTGGFGGGGGGTGAFGSGGGVGGGGFAGSAGSGTNGGGGAGLGGGVFNHGGTLTIANSTFSGNTAQGGGSGQGLGGGVFNRNGTATINHATFADNIAAQGGGLYNLGDGAVATLTLDNSILADSTGSTDCTSTIFSMGTTINTGNRNLIESNTLCPGATVTTNPALGPLQNNGGPTNTHALPAGSSAIDQAVAGGLMTDQRGIGFARTSDDPSVPNGTGDGSDIGSFELIVSQSANLSITKTDSPDPVLTGGTLTYTVNVSNAGPSDATNVVVTDNLPSQVTFGTCSSTGGGVCGGSGNSRTVTFASLANGVSATITFTATVNCSLAGGVVISNTASVSSDTSDPDSANNSSTAMTTTNNPAPTITCPANITKSNDPNQCGAVATFPTPTPSDNCAGTTVTCSPASGSFFPKGTTTVTCTATDSGGAMANCTFTVTVNDTQPPTITCPANITKSNDPDQCGAVATYPAPTVGDNCPGVGTPSCSPASGSFFPKGTTTVTCTVADSSSNTAPCTFTVTVNDTQPPTITCPPNQTVKTPSINNTCVTVNFAAPTSTDNCPGVTTACTPPSGSCFPVGTTTVTCTATDTSGNTATCSFSVTVFNVCLQDDTNPNIVFLGNTITGAYLFCCNGTVFTGVATVTKRGNVATFVHNASDRRVQASVDEGVFKGTASLQSPPGTIRCTIQDRDTRNNTCVCQ